MAAFQPSVSLSQSPDGATITVTDTSNYDSNTDGVTLGNIISRTDTLYDGLNSTITSVVFTPGQLTATVTITKDYYINNALSFIIPGPITRTGVDNFLADNFYNNKAREVSRALRCCDCGCDKLCTTATKANLAHKEAQTAFLFGVASESQNAIDDANSLINTEDCGC